MAKRTKYGELTKMLSVRVPESMFDRVRDIVYLSIDKMQREKVKDDVDEIVPASSFVAVKEPTQIKSIFIPFTSKAIKVLGYACLKDEEAGLYYWKDSSITALVFDSEKHLKDYLIKNVM